MSILIGLAHEPVFNAAMAALVAFQRPAKVADDGADSLTKEVLLHAATDPPQPGAGHCLAGRDQAQARDSTGDPGRGERQGECAEPGQAAPAGSRGTAARRAAPPPAARLHPGATGRGRAGGDAGGAG
ncbi:conserved protein of unknown function [Ectopseudomonas oleovorans]|uniref:Uncharacterized protein n=1 Tax=Ectopseudomonas oleovorans TaxID=301 RepID=A0A653B8X7_ECTOL|nr:conserved protein of unknown function [Pseudomonas oleovorans]